MQQMEAKVVGIQKLNGFTDVYEVTLEVPEIYATYVSNIPPIRLYIGASRIERYKQLYMTEEKFYIGLP